MELKKNQSDKRNLKNECGIIEDETKNCKKMLNYELDLS